jgi:hypothetical protein
MLTVIVAAALVVEDRGRARADARPTADTVDA